KELTWEEVKSLCDTFNTDAVLSIDHFKTRVITAYDKNDYFSQSENLFYERAEAEIKISFEVVIRVYDPAREKIESRFILRDTLVWDDSGTTVGELFARFTPIKDALSEVGIAVALEFAN